MPLYETATIPRQNATLRVVALFAALVSVLWVSTTVVSEKLDTPPSSFPTNTVVTIEEGATLKEITQLLKEAHVIRSSWYLHTILATTYKNDFAQAGTYHFSSALSTQEIAHAITHGEHRSPLKKVTFPEGFRARDFYSFIPDITETISLETLASHEGYLFPDTYFITSDMTADDIFEQLSSTFEEKIRLYDARIQSSGFTREEVIILASIIEREASDVESKRIVSGILQNRLRDNMPLQVDAVFDYLLNKESRELTVEDLAIESPYNTYTNTGLPPTPIANPGIESIEAVLDPTPSEYLYYLTDNSGVFHYARTFEEHKKNKARYLR